MSKLIVLAGIPGSGKSYLCSLVKKIKKSHVYIVSSDELRNLITGDQADLSKDAIMWQMFYELPKVYAKDPNALVFLDATHASVEYRTKSIENLIPLFDEVKMIVFELDKGLVDNQNIAREHPVPQNVLDFFYDNFEDISEKDKETFSEIHIIKSKEQLPHIIEKI